MSEEVKSVVRYIFEKTGDTVLKASTGLIIFLLVDGIISTFLSLLDKSIKPFEFTLQIYEIVKTLGDTFGYGYTILTVYILLWGWGQIVYILRQPLFLDNLKSDYLFWETDKDISKVYKSIREKVVNKLTTQVNDLRDIIQQEKTNDYLLYQILGKYKALYTNIKGTREANDVAFIATNLIFIATTIYLYYALLILSQIEDLFEIKEKILKILIVILVFFFPIFFLMFIVMVPLSLKRKKFLFYVLIGLSILIEIGFAAINMPEKCKYMLMLSTSLFLSYILNMYAIYIFLLERVQNRLISRNLKIYINFLLHGSKLDKELREKEDNDNTTSKKSDS